MFTRLVLGLLGLAALCTAASAGPLQLDGRHRWVAVFSTQSLDAAIGVARLYEGQSSRVVRSKNGWLGVVFGPVEAANIDSFRAQYQSWPNLPDDALLSRGSTYIETLWEPPQPSHIVTEEFKSDLVGLRDGSLEIQARKVTTGDYEAYFVVTGSTRADHLFQISTPTAPSSDYGSEMSIVRLDRSTPFPQVVVSVFSGGAHCCTSSWIISQNATGVWTSTAIAAMDGDGVYYEDVDGDGSLEVVSSDNSFLYTFDCYACSNPPLRIWQFSDLELTDASNQPRFISRFRQEIAGMEYEAKSDPDLWRANGFLAGWVAAKARIGEIDSAWAKMLTLYDRAPMFSVSICPDGSDQGNCPDGALRQLAFPAGLARHLEKNGYGPLPAAIAAYLPAAPNNQPVQPTAPPGHPDGGSVFTRSGGATFTLSDRQLSGQMIALITVEGELKAGDEKSFKQAVLAADAPIIVSLKSPGGDLNAGIEIGRAIWSNQLRTVVQDDVCASACAIAWLAGRPRYATANAHIGFHAPMKADDISHKVDAVGSAFVGGYLNELGFTKAAIAYMTAAKSGRHELADFK